MTSSAFIAHLLDPLVDPQYADREQAYAKAFHRLTDEDKCRDYLRGFKRVSTYALDWAGDKLLIATKDNYLRLFDVENGGVEERTWLGEWMSMSIDPNNPHIAAAISWSGKCRVFDARSSSTAVHDQDMKKTDASLKEFLFLCWSPDSRHIAVNNRSDQVYLLDLRGKAIRIGAGISMQSEVNQMVWSGVGNALWIATGGSPGRIHVLPTPGLQKEGASSVVAHQYTTISMAVDPSGRHIASGGGDCLVALWDPAHLICTRTFGHATQSVTTLGFNHDGSLLAWGTGGSGSTGGEKNLTIVGTNSGTLHWQDNTPAPVQQVKWHAKKQTLAYTLNVSQLPDERDLLRDDMLDRRDTRDRHMRDRGETRHAMRVGSSRDAAVVHVLRVPGL